MTIWRWSSIEAFFSRPRPPRGGCPGGLFIPDRDEVRPHRSEWSVLNRAVVNPVQHAHHSGDGPNAGCRPRHSDTRPSGRRGPAADAGADTGAGSVRTVRLERQHDLGAGKRDVQRGAVRDSDRDGRLPRARHLLDPARAGEPPKSESVAQPTPTASAQRDRHREPGRSRRESERGAGTGRSAARSPDRFLELLLTRGSGHLSADGLVLGPWGGQVSTDGRHARQAALRIRATTSPTVSHRVLSAA